MLQVRCPAHPFTMPGRSSRPPAACWKGYGPPVSETALPADPVDAEELRARVDRALVALLDHELDALDFMDGDLDVVAGVLRRFVLEGGKRLRPAFVWWGYRGAGGPPRGPRAEAVVRAACSVEAMHVEFAGLHRGWTWRGDPAAFGTGAAVLMGDLAFTWADTALAEAGLPDDRLVAALKVFNRLRSELMGGQYLDLLEARRGAPGEAAVRRVLNYKSGKYTIERRLLESALGDAKLTDDDVEAVREVIATSGALARTEDRVAELLAEAKAALAASDGIDEQARAALAALADHVTDRSS